MAKVVKSFRLSIQTINLIDQMRERGLYGHCESAADVIERLVREEQARIRITFSSSKT